MSGVAPSPKLITEGGGHPATEWSKNPLPSLKFENPFELFQSKIGDAMDGSGRASELISAGSSDNDAMGQLDEDEEAAKKYDLDTGFHGMRIKTGVLGGSDPEMQHNIDRAKALDGMNYNKFVAWVTGNRPGGSRRLRDGVDASLAFKALDLDDSGLLIDDEMENITPFLSAPVPPFASVGAV